MKIYKYSQFINELHMNTSNLIQPGTILNLKFTDDDGVHMTKCHFNWGYSPHREPIYYELDILESDSEKYNVGAQLILGFDFNGKVDKFLFHPNMSGHGSYQELHYEAKVDIQP
jgi:hypothetical protein